MSFTYIATAGMTQSELSSSYTNALSSYLQGDGADLVAFLACTVNHLSVDDAMALKAAVESGNFSLSGLFSAAQSKEGEVNPDDPTPTLTVGGVVINLSDMLTGLDTMTWDTATKKFVITHTREFFTGSENPDGYATNWADPQIHTNQAPTADAIVLNLTEYDEKAAANSNPDLTDVNLLTAANAADADGDSLAVVAGSVKVDNGDGTYSNLPAYISYTDGVLSIDKNHSSLDDLYLGATWNVEIVYQITDGEGNTIDNTVSLAIAGTADQFADSTSITVTKIGGPAYTETGVYTLLGSDWSNGSVNVTGFGDYDRNIEGFTVTLDVDATYAGTATTGNTENSFMAVNPSETLDDNWSADGDLDYTVTFTGPVDGSTVDDPDASTVSIDFSYNYWM